MCIRLVGKRDTRRTEYFLRAAEQCGIPVCFSDWDDVDRLELAGDVVKLDPPSWQTADLFRMNDQIGRYREMLAKMGERNCRFLNPPEGIVRVLDKEYCKKILMEKGVPVTKMISGEIHGRQELLEIMQQHKVYSVFIKPLFCSGAAGVVAYRRIPGGEREVAYTSCCLREGELVNTKTLYCLKDSHEIRQLLDAVLSLGAVVERWHPKAIFRGKSFDLRVVWQFGKPVFSVARQSRGPVTNLHLNNAPLPMGELFLPDNIINEVYRVCEAAMDAFPELTVAGLDILLEKDTLKPHIIEINGQGDLMYQDIFEDNRIYKEQVLRMAHWHAGK